MSVDAGPMAGRITSSPSTQSKSISGLVFPQDRFESTREELKVRNNFKIAAKTQQTISLSNKIKELLSAHKASTAVNDSLGSIFREAVAEAPKRALPRRKANPPDGIPGISSNRPVI
jgi:hypothetical protein